VRAFFEARIEHPTINDRVRVECLGKMPDGSRCNRVAFISDDQPRRYSTEIELFCPVAYHFAQKGRSIHLDVQSTHPFPILSLRSVCASGV
jgi:hypothetical protein